MISSAILTTYSTTKFLKYKAPHAAGSYHQISPSSSNPSQLSHTRQDSLLRSIPRHTLLTWYRFTGSFLLGLLLHPDLLSTLSRLQSTLSIVPDFVVPAVFLFIANLTNTISLNRIGISLTYTSKCAIPLLTVLITYLLDGRTSLPNLYAVLALLPIAGGIAAASWNAPTFEPYGFVTAILSATAQSALNISSKKAMLRTKTTGPAAQRAMVTIGSALSTVSMVTALLSLPPTRNVPTKTTTTDSVEKTSRVSPPAWLTVLAIISYHIEYSLSFHFIKMVHPVTLGACDALRRLGIILSGRFFFGGDPLTRLNAVGILVSLLGVTSYSIAKSMS